MSFDMNDSAITLIVFWICFTIVLVSLIFSINNYYSNLPLIEKCMSNCRTTTAIGGSYTVLENCQLKCIETFNQTKCKE